MLACIVCAKPELEEGGDDTARAGTPSTKDAVKSLSSQLKDMALKFSGAYRQCKGGSSTSFRPKPHHHRYRYPAMDDYDADSQYTFLQAASSSSTPAWDFMSERAAEPGTSKDKWVLSGGGGAAVVAGEGKDAIMLENREPREWVAQVEPGVHITFLSLAGGAGNDLKRIRFSREMFNKWQAQRWWGENYDRIMELYNVQKFSRQALPTPPRSDDGGEQRESFYSRTGSMRESPATPPLNRDRLSRHIFRPPPVTVRSGGGSYLPSVIDPSEHIIPNHFRPSASNNWAVAPPPPARGETSSVDASRTTTSSRDDPASISVSNASEQDVSEWVEQDEPGVYITLRELPDGARELRRVRFSREKFGEVHAKLWWEENRERIQAQYL